MKRVVLVLGFALVLSACCTEALYGRAYPESTWTTIALHDGKTPLETNAEGMLPIAACKKLCPHQGDGAGKSCSPAELVTDHPEERIIVCGDHDEPRSFRFQELPEDVKENEPFFRGPACVRICGAATTGGCHLLPKIPIVEGKRFIVCRYHRDSGCAPHVAAIGGCQTASR